MLGRDFKEMTTNVYSEPAVFFFKKVFPIHSHYLIKDFTIILEMIIITHLTEAEDEAKEVSVHITSQ